MNQDVKACVEARTNFFSQYVTVPAALQPQVEAFIAEVTALGEASADAASFEGAFASGGLSDRFNALVPQCSQKAVEMTPEQKQQAKETFIEMNGGKEGLAKHVLRSAASDVQSVVEEEAIAQTRRAMIEDGTLDDYTRATNVVEDAGRLGGFLKGLFGKK